jgi:glycosyltransferase involved in cell wall biosynthesis
VSGPAGTGARELRIVMDARRVRDFGIGTYIRNLLAAIGELDRVNHYFLIVHPADAGELPKLPENFSTVTWTPQRWTRALTWPMFLRSFKADLYHLPLNVVPFFMPQPYIVTTHDMSSLVYDESKGLRHDWRLFRFRRGLLRAAHIISVSHATRHDIEGTLGIPASRLEVIYNAPDPIFTAATLGLELDESYRVMERYQINYPFILYTGNIRPQKNIPRLIEAFSVLRGELARHPIYSDLRLIIIGHELSRHSYLRQAVIRSRVEQSVRFLGFVPIHTLRIFYKAAAAFAFPSLYEGFGLPPLEAMASGTPVATSNVSSLPEVVGDAAVLVNPENVFDIARGLREVLLDETIRRRCIERGYKQVERFSWRTSAEQVLRIYRRVSGIDPQDASRPANYPQSGDRS